MQNPNPVIPLQATLNGCNVIIRGLRKLPIDEALDLLNELSEQVNTHLKGLEDAEKAGDKAVDAVVKSLRKGRPKGAKNKPKEPVVDAGVPVL